MQGKVKLKVLYEATLASYMHSLTVQTCAENRSFKASLRQLTFSKPRTVQHPETYLKIPD